ncbi:phytochromobilin:ferredoxin oxidoreductase, chloroplastic isoform X1 [Helianthus annuus]|uniref:phytochromobilin:ferredoxin oxidoreductase, chloroplastic isoform X1 n=1 Tax=Helianthus annuus TaxID=4232 RepID=UPI000B9050A3|nr:phytochromobilin:ferredoxin oxidoreductase, chloroplastic isoform X1 [Helianthus annuus]
MVVSDEWDMRQLRFFYRFDIQVWDFAFLSNLKLWRVCCSNKLLPWGGKLTSESLKFFFSIVIWTRFSSSHEKLDILFLAFTDYYKVWLSLMNQATEETDVSQISLNREAPHRYLTWRTQKDPGYNLLKRLIGVTLAEVFLPSDVKDDIDKLNVDLNNTAGTLRQKAHLNSLKLRFVFDNVRSSMIAIAIVMLLASNPKSPLFITHLNQILR